MVTALQNLGLKRIERMPRETDPLYKHVLGLIAGNAPCAISGTFPRNLTVREGVEFKLQACVTQLTVRTDTRRHL
jgi:hypothetical protein